jgi:hypothetical protein
MRGMYQEMARGFGNMLNALGEGLARLRELGALEIDETSVRLGPMFSAFDGVALMNGAAGPERFSVSDPDSIYLKMMTVASHANSREAALKQVAGAADKPFAEAAREHADQLNELAGAKNKLAACEKLSERPLQFDDVLEIQRGLAAGSAAEAKPSRSIGKLLMIWGTVAWLPGGILLLKFVSETIGVPLILGGWLVPILGYILYRVEATKAGSDAFVADAVARSHEMGPLSQSMDGVQELLRRAQTRTNSIARA